MGVSRNVVCLSGLSGLITAFIVCWNIMSLTNDKEFIFSSQKYFPRDNLRDKVLAWDDDTQVWEEVGKMTKGQSPAMSV